MMMTQQLIRDEAAIRALHQQRERARRRAMLCYLLFMPLAAYSLTHFVVLWVPASMLSSFAQTVFDQPAVWAITMILSVLALAGGIAESMRAERLVFYTDPEQTAALRELGRTAPLRRELRRVLQAQGGIFEFQVQALRKRQQQEDSADWPLEPDTQPES